MTEYRAISLWQPWASLIFTGDKKHETRSFLPPERVIGQRIAIHAAKRDANVSVGLHILCEHNWGAGGAWRGVLPFGAIVGTVRLVEAYATESIEPSTVDRVTGDWTPGRFAWRLADAELLSSPIPWRGRQGWFPVEIGEP